MAKRTLSEELWKGLSDGVADIREKFEESVWGRSVTERGDAAQWPEAEQQPSFGSVTHTIDVGPTHEQIGENANYRLAAMERECNSPAWPQAEQSHAQRIEQE